MTLDGFYVSCIRSLSISHLLSILGSLSDLLIHFVKEKGLAKYKWPEKMVYTAIPRNPAGKIEKPKLRDTYVKPAKEAMEKEFKKQS